MLFILCIVPRAGWSANFDVYFLVVGNSSYASPGAPDQTGLPDIFGANNGARALSERLRQGGARFGIILTSEDAHLVTLDDIRSALNRVADVEAGAHPANPLVVFYFAGHGMSDGVAWNLFALPGAFTYRGRPESLPVEQLADHSLHAAWLADYLNKLNVPYLAIWDTCYSGQARRFDAAVLTRTASQNLGDVARALRTLNEFHQTSPVLFSTIPGTAIAVVPDPTDPSRNIGPLARRAILAIDPVIAGHREVSLDSFVRSLTSPELDIETHPAVTFAEHGATWQNGLISSLAQPGPVEVRSGSARTADACCAPPPQRAESRFWQGSLELSGGAGEYITNGRKVTINGATVSVTEHDDRSLDIEFGIGETTWDVELAAPNGARFARGRYEGAQRLGADNAGRPEFSVTGNGRGCNEVKGSFTVNDVDYDTAGRMDRLAVQFTQLCDDIRVPLTGIVTLNGK